MGVPTGAGGSGALIENSGTIVAPGGTVVLSAATARAAARNAVNISGTIDTHSIAGRSGSIIIGGGEGGAVAVSGTLDASGSGPARTRATAPGGRRSAGQAAGRTPAPFRAAAPAKGPGAAVAGGTVSIDGAALTNTGRLDVSGASGGHVGLTGRTLVNQGSIDLHGTSGAGGSLEATLAERYTSSTAATIGASGILTGGRIAIAAPQSLERGHLDVTATSGTGGSIQLLGTAIDLQGAALDASGGGGGGTVLIGGGARGLGVLPHAATVTTDDATTIAADATDRGDGGHVVLWSDERTAFGGLITARGGMAGGNGGVVETSSHLDLSVPGAVSANARSATGRGGEWLLDPADIIITAADSNISEPPGSAWTATAAAATVSATTIQNQLNMGTSVTIQTSGGAAGGTGNISVLAPIAKTTGGAATLTLTADNQLSIASNITSTSGALNLVLTSSGSAAITGATITTNGGNLTLNAAATGTNSGLTLTNATLNVGAGIGALTASSPNGHGVEFSGSSTLTAMSGSIAISGTTQTPSVSWGAGVTIDANATLTASGTITLTGSGSTGHGLSIQSGAAVNSFGNVTLQGTVSTSNQYFGLVFAGNATLTDNGGNLSVQGNSPAWRGIEEYSGTLTINNAAAGIVNLTGTTTSQYGFLMESGAAISASGLVQLAGTSSGTGTGVLLQGNTITGSAGPISLTGTSSGSIGINFTGNNTLTESSSGTGFFVNATANSSVGFIQYAGTATLNNSGSGTILLTATTASGSAVKLVNNANMTTTGAVQIAANATGSGTGVLFNGSNILTTSSGTLTVGGTSSTGLGVSVANTTLAGNTGSIALSGTGGADGIDVLSNDTLSTSGTVNVTGTSTGGGNGVDLQTAAGVTSTGILTVQATTASTSSGNGALYLTGGNTVTVSSGSASYAGTSAGSGGVLFNSGTASFLNNGTGNLSVSANAPGIAFWSLGSTINTAGSVQLSGTSVTGSGFKLNSNTTIAPSSGSTLAINGTSGSGNGIFITSAQVVNDASASVIMTGSSATPASGNYAVRVDAAGAITTSGPLLIQEAAGSTGTPGINLAGPITDNGSVTINTSHGATVSGVVSGSGTLTTSGTGTTTLTATDSYTGTTTIGAGSTLMIDNGGTAGLPGSGAVVDNGTLVFDRSDAVTIPNAISGTGIITQAGTGTTSLSANPSSTGALNVNAGTLKFTSSAWMTPWSFSGVTINGGTLDLEGGGHVGVKQGTTIAYGLNGGTLYVGNGTNFFPYQAGPLTISTAGGAQAFLIGSGSVLNVNNITATTFNIARGTGSSDLVVGDIWNNGGFTKTGNGILELNAVNTYAGTTTISAGTLAVTGAGSLGSGSFASSIIDNGTLEYSSSANQILSGVVSGSGVVVKDTSATATLNLSGTNTYTGSTTINAGTLALTGSGSLGSGSYAGAIVDNGTLGDRSSATQTLSGVISGSGTLVKDTSATSTLDVAASNTFSGGTTLTAGTLITSATTTPLGTGLITMNGGTLQSDPTYATLLPNNVKVNAVPGNQVVVPIGQNLQLNGNLLGSGTLTKSGGYSLVLSGDDSGFSGTFQNIQSHTFLNTLTAGSAAANWVNTGQFLGAINSLNGTIYLGSLSGTGDLSTAYGATASYVIGGNNTSTTFSGVIGANYSAGPVSVTKVGTGTLTLTGANAYTGTTTISGGVLQVGNGSTGGTLSPAAVTDNASLVYNLPAAATIGNAISGTGVMSATVAGALTLNGAVNLTGAGGVALSANSIALNAALSTPALQLTATSGGLSEGASGVVTATTASAQASGSIALNTATNAIGTFAGASTAGNVVLTDTGSLTIGTVNGIAGVTASTSGSQLITTGALTIAQPVTTADTSSSALVLAAGDGTAAGTTSGGDITVSGAGMVSTGAGGQANLYTGGGSGNASVAALATAGSFRYNSTRTSTGYSRALSAGVNVIYRRNPTLTVTIGTGGVTSRTYTGLPTTPSDTISGALNGDTPIISGSISGGPAQNAGSYTFSSSALTNDLGYAMSVASVGYTITAAPLTVTANPASKTYDGLGYSGGNGVTYAGFVNGETATVLGGALAYGGTAQGAVNAGSYTITPGGSTAANYALSYEPGTLTIGQAPLSILADNRSKIHGQTLALGTTGFTTTQTLYGRDSVSGVTLASGGTPASAAAGLYTIIPSAAIGSNLSNYAVTYLTGTLRVDQAPVSDRLAYLSYGLEISNPIELLDQDRSKTLQKGCGTFSWKSQTGCSLH